MNLPYTLFILYLNYLKQTLPISNNMKYRYQMFDYIGNSVGQILHDFSCRNISILKFLHPEIGV